VVKIEQEPICRQKARRSWSSGSAKWMLVKTDTQHRDRQTAHRGSQPDTQPTDGPIAHRETYSTQTHSTETGTAHRGTHSTQTDTQRQTDKKTGTDKWTQTERQAQTGKTAPQTDAWADIRTDSCTQDTQATLGLHPSLSS
jgi:hypothetical protein